MGQEGKPKSQSEKCEVSSVAHSEALPPERRTPIRQGSQETICSSRLGPAFAQKLRRGRDRRSTFHDAGRIDSAIIAKLLPKNVEHISAGV
jgi:hypothetical protein